MQLCRDYSHHFTVHGKDVSSHARHYLTGLLGTERRKNIERIESDVAESNYQGMQQFITDSPWSHEALLEQAAADADGLLGGDRDTALYLDETSFVKKGELSVGVQRQYCGRLGKTENCQVGVFACLGRGRHAALVDFRLFLPESWAQDEARCVRAKIPEDRRKHLTKTELALEMVRAARARGSRHQWIGGDEVYGGNLAFCAQLEDLGETFLMDVGAATVVWDADPAPRVPATPEGTHGRPRRRALRTEESAGKHQVSQLTAAHFDRENRRLTMRETTQGPLQARLWVREVWLWAQGAPRARRRLLIVRREADGTHKYSLSNAPADTSWERLGRMQAQRFWIEQAFKEAKSELGMAHYEVRGWKGWHHHMALVCLAQLFTVRERLAALPAVPLLSARDLVELLDHYLPRRPRNEDEVFRQMALRHQRRAQAQVSHAKRTGVTSKIT
ncbi:MAG: IS701 family transposase [Verrucomicrobiota bacterium]